MFDPSAGNGLATGAYTDRYRCFDQGAHIEQENVGGFAAVVDVLADGAGGLRGTGAWGRSLCGPGSRAYGLRMSLILACALDRGAWIARLLTRRLQMKKVMLAVLLLCGFSLTAQAACPVFGPSEDPCSGPVFGPSTCECP